MIDLWFVKDFNEHVKMVSKQSYIFWGVFEPPNLKLKIAFFIHELYEEIMGNTQGARKVENVWRKLMGMKLRTIGSMEKHCF